MSPRGLTLLLKNASVYDGAGGAPVRSDVGVAGDRIALVGGAAAAASAGTVLECSGMALCPGFVDVHSHSEFTLLADPRAEGKARQGVTTEINGNCGLSAGPLLGDALARREEDLREYAIPERWATLGEYMGLLEARGPALNFATLAGHGNIRASVMGYADRGPSGSELEGMKALLREALADGALGLSSGLIYPPGIYSGRAEMAALARAGREAAGGGFIYTSHMRSEGEGLLESIDETLRVGQEAGVPVHISHLKTAGRDNWPKAGQAMEMLQEARRRGQGVTCDRYPYTASSTDLDSVLPAWAFEGGSESELQRLRDPGTRQRLEAELGQRGARWEEIYVCSVANERSRWAEGMSIEAIAGRMGRPPVEAVIELLLENSLRVGAIFHSMSPANLRGFLSLPFTMVGSDSSARSLDGPTRRGMPHPRGFGSFPRYLRGALSPSHMGLEDGFLPGAPDPLSEAIRRITLLPAVTFGLAGRGRIAEGYYADLVVFDPECISDRATFDDPFEPPEGVRDVFVNGTAVVRGGEMTGQRPGRVLRGGGL